MTGEARQRIGNRSHKAMLDISVRVPVVQLQMSLVHGGSATVRIGRGIERVRPGVAQVGAETVHRALTKNYSETVVGGDTVAPDIADLADQLIGTTGLESLFVGTCTAAGFEIATAEEKG